MAAVFSPDGRRIVTTSVTGDGHLWDAETYVEIATLRGHRGALGMATFSPDGSLVATVSVEGTARLWDASDGTEVGVFGPDGDGGPVSEAFYNFETDAAFSPDGSRLVVASRDGRVRLWDVRSKTQMVVSQDVSCRSCWSLDGSCG